MGVAVVLSHPDDAVEPGAEATTDVRIRNTGAVVDQFELDIAGDAAAWAQVEPAQMNLMPGEEGTARLVFAPPRSSQVVAGLVPYALRVMSLEDTAGSWIEEGTITVGPYSQIAADLVPRTSYGKFAGRHELALDNLGNHPELASVMATDPDLLLNLRRNSRQSERRAWHRDLRQDQGEAEEEVLGRTEQDDSLPGDGHGGGRRTCGPAGARCCSRRSSPPGCSRSSPS